VTLFSQTAEWPAAAPDTRWADWRQRGWEYLRSALGDRLPSELRPVQAFDEHPLDGEGPVGLFTFDLPVGDPVLRRLPTADPAHYLVAGQTDPNYFPTYGLSPDQGYSLHIGTRFMLVLGISLAETPGDLTPVRAALEDVALGCNPGRSTESLEPVAVYRADQQQFAAFRLRMGSQEFYAIGGDCPPGFYELTNLPTAVVLRLHLGQLIRAEARAERGDGRERSAPAAQCSPGNSPGGR
jgi:hypothetical protein